MPHSWFAVFVGWVISLLFVSNGFDFRVLLFGLILWGTTGKSRVAWIAMAFGLCHGLFWLSFHQVSVPTSGEEIEGRIIKVNAQSCSAQLERRSGLYLVQKPCEVGELFRGRVEFKDFRADANKVIQQRAEFRHAGAVWGYLKFTELRWSKSGERSFLETVRLWGAQVIKSELPHVEAFRFAIFLGDGSRFPRTYWEALNKLGISHLLVASGSHLTALFFVLLMFLGRVTWRFPHPWGERTKDVVLLMMGFGILALMNFSVSMGRAYGSFLAVAAVSRLLPWVHRYSSLDRMGAVGLFLLILDPTVVSDPSFYLTFFAAAAVIVAMNGPVQSRWWALLVIPSLSVQFVTALLSYNSITWTVVANFVASVVFACVLIPLLFLSFVAQPVARLLESILREVLSWVLSVADAGTMAPHLPLSIGAALLLGWFWLVFNQRSGALRQWGFVGLGAIHLGVKMLF